MTGRRESSCLDEPEVDYCWTLFSRIVRSTATSPTSRACGEIFCVGRTGFSCRGIAKSECVSYPSKNRRFSVVQCVRTSLLRECEGLVPWYRSTERADSPCSGHTDSTYNSKPEYWEWDLEMARDSRPGAPFQPRFFLQELIRGRCPFDWLSQDIRENRKRHLRPGRYQLLIVERQALNLPIIAQNTRCLSTTLAFIFINAVWLPCSTAAFWFRDQQQQSSYVGTGQAARGGHRGRARRMLSAISSSMPLRSFPIPKTQHRLSGLIPRIGTTNSANGAAIQDGAVVRVKSQPPLGSPSTVA